MPEEDYLYNHHGEKWDCGQQLDHINRTVAVLAKASTMPRFLIRLKFGKANRPSRSYDEVVAFYRKGIEDGFKATGPFIPEAISYVDRQFHIDKMMKNIHKIERNIGKYSERNLDEIIVPHPALGILTMREIMYFTTYHVEDHIRQIKRNLSYRKSET